MREVKEETALDKQALNYSICFLIILVKVEDMEKLKVSKESHRLEFVDKHNICKLDVVETHQHILNRFLSWNDQVIIE